MNVTALKMEMVEMISQTYDEATINRLYSKLLEAIEEEERLLIEVENETNTGETWWEDMPQQAQERILTSYKESFDAVNWIDHEDMKKRHAKWLRK